VSSYTGLPTLVGWSEHELGWRGNWEIIAARMGDIEKMYKSASKDEVDGLVQKYRVRYVVLGDKEKAKYGPNAGFALQQLSTTVMRSGNAQLLLIN